MACIVIVVTLDESRALKMAVFSEIFLEGGDEEMLLRVEGFACQDTCLLESQRLILRDSISVSLSSPY